MRTVFCCLLLMALIGELFGACGGDYDWLSGNISSPNYPDPYEPNLNCTWIFRHPEVIGNQSVVINLKVKYDTEENKDNITVIWSEGNDNSSVVLTGSGMDSLRQLNTAVIKNSNMSAYVKIVFVTNGENEKKGFTLTWAVTGKQCSTVADCNDPGNINAPVTCDTWFNNAGAAGKYCLCKPGYKGFPYPGYSKCVQRSCQCVTNAECVNGKCECKDGYIGNGYQVCELPTCANTPALECHRREGNVIDTNSKSHCTKKNREVASCVCEEGYIGKVKLPADCIPISDKDYCYKNDDFCATANATCSENVCACKKGFEGNGGTPYDKGECTLTSDATTASGFLYAILSFVFLAFANTFA